MLVSYTLECGHVYNYMRHIKLKDGKRWCRKCKGYKKVIHIQEVPALSTLGIFG